jgi:antitoxin VapB
VSLNIKSPEADRLIQALADLTGESKTRAVIEALRERLEREQRSRDRKTLRADLLEIGRRCAAYGRHDTTDHGELLYDEHGLPQGNDFARTDLAAVIE